MGAYETLMLEWADKVQTLDLDMDKSFKRLHPDTQMGADWSSSNKP